MSERMDAKPSGKTGLTVVAGAVVTVLVWVATTQGVDVPAEVAAAVTTILAAVVAYFVPAKSGKYVESDATPVPKGYKPEH